MAFDRLPFNPPPRSNLRERLLEKQARRLREFTDTATTLQEERKTDLSPLERKLNEQYVQDLKAASERLSDELKFVKLQSAAEDEIEEALARKNPLERERNRFGYYRSSNDRNTAIAGILERERDLASRFSRVPTGRVQATAAARRRARSLAFGIEAYKIALDPCEEYRLAVKVRRQVMFAKGLARNGYRTAHRSRKPFGC